MANNNILLIEPGYKNKYPPLGLMKIAQYHGENGKKDNVTFIKGTDDKKVFEKAWDRIYITTLFSFEWSRISKTIDFALKVANNHANKIFVGGIATSLMHEKFLEESRWSGIRFIKGLLAENPADSLELDDFEDELYSDDKDSDPIEDLIPDYNILKQIDYDYPVQDAYFVYASRGCVRKCHFCGVPKLEGDQRDTYSLTKTIKGIDELYGQKKDLTLMDNNIVASANFKNIIAEIVDLGFEKGATISRNGGIPVNRRVDFNQGVDARILCKTDMFLKEISKVCIRPLRIAFDHIGLKKPYEKAIRYSADVGLMELSNYMLYNFHDTPEDLYERMRLNIDLNQELKTKIFSFPMRYQPTDRQDRGFVGEHWNKYYLRSFQIILQATHGIVSGAPDFFKRAFGDNSDEFKKLLMMPQHFIFNRDWYEKKDGKPELEQYKKDFNTLSNNEQKELLQIVCDNTPIQMKKAVEKQSNKKLASVLNHYLPLSDEESAVIWEKQKKKNQAKEKLEAKDIVPDEERVEDAGLEVA
tara:strand:- start:1316 stop:2899 length:1584 start_codon:yes stop_codon:yes gene_type:complete